MCIFFSQRYDKDFTIESDSMIEKGNMHASIYSIHYIRCKGNQVCKDCFRRSVTGCSICPFCCLPYICFSIHPGFLSIFRFVSDLHFVWHGSSACCHNSHGIHSELNREQTSVPCHDQSSVISTCVVHCIMYNKLHVHVVKCTLTCCHDQSYLISASVVHVVHVVHVVQCTCCHDQSYLISASVVQ